MGKGSTASAKAMKSSSLFYGEMEGRKKKAETERDSKNMTPVTLKSGFQNGRLLKKKKRRPGNREGARLHGATGKALSHKCQGGG